MAFLIVKSDQTCDALHSVLGNGTAFLLHVQACVPLSWPIFVMLSTSVKALILFMTVYIFDAAGHRKERSGSAAEASDTLLGAPMCANERI